MAMGNTWGMGGLGQPIAAGAGAACVSFWTVLLEMEVGPSFWKGERKGNRWKRSLGGDVGALAALVRHATSWIWRCVIYRQSHDKQWFNVANVTS